MGKGCSARVFTRPNRPTFPSSRTEAGLFRNRPWPIWVWGRGRPESWVGVLAPPACNAVSRVAENWGEAPPLREEGNSTFLPCRTAPSTRQYHRSTSTPAAPHLADHIDDYHYRRYDVQYRQLLGRLPTSSTRFHPAAIQSTPSPSRLKSVPDFPPPRVSGVGPRGHAYASG